MAHELAKKADGSAMMMYSGKTPWHLLGTKLDELATADECMAAAGLDVEVLSLPMYAKAPDGTEIEVPSQVLNVRKDTMESLGVVSDKYRVVQNSEAFGFLDSIVASGGMKYETAGALGKGERIWMLGKIPGHVRVRGTDDITEKYLLLYNSHNATSALRAFFTPIRVVCANTVAAAMRGAGDRGYSFRHTGDLASKIDDARRALALASDYFTAFGEGADFLAGYKPSKAELTRYFESLYPDPEDGKDAAKAKSVRMTLFGLFDQGMGQDMPGIKGTAWAAYNAVTEYVDHNTGRNAAKRLDSAWFGDGAKLKARAWDGAVELAEGRMDARMLQVAFN